MKPRALGVIPARIGSSRLPRKPLYSLAGRPLIEWVWRRAAEAGLFEQLVIATDSEEVVRAAQGFGAEAVLTSDAHSSGTDRVAEVALRPGYRHLSLIVNVQGDEPFVEREHLLSALQLVAEGRARRWEVGTVATPLSSLEEWRDPAVVKVVRDRDGGAMLFSRAPIPFFRDGEPGERDLRSGASLRHLGIYAYRREALLRWVTLPEGELEQIERLEQLRPLAAGMRIGVAAVRAAPESIGVDTPAQAERAEFRLRAEISSGARAIA